MKMKYIIPIIIVIVGGYIAYKIETVDVIPDWFPIIGVAENIFRSILSFIVVIITLILAYIAWRKL